MLLYLLEEGQHVGVRRIDQSVESVQFLAPSGLGQRVNLEHPGKHPWLASDGMDICRGPLVATQR